jgi:hypothetical protein
MAHPGHQVAVDIGVKFRPDYRWDFLRYDRLSKVGPAKLEVSGSSIAVIERISLCPWRSPILSFSLARVV